MTSQLREIGNPYGEYDRYFCGKFMERMNSEKRLMMLFRIIFYRSLKLKVITADFAACQSLVQIIDPVVVPNS
jgi:hypothetical protein